MKRNEIINRKLFKQYKITPPITPLIGVGLLFLILLWLYKRLSILLQR